MAHYVLAIDETGLFALGTPQSNRSEKTFVCGVCLKDIDEKSLTDKFSELRDKFKEFKSNFPEEYIKSRKKEFHYMEMTQREKDSCIDFFSPMILKIIKSEGGPAIYANNQDWWLSALITVVDGFFKNTMFKFNDTIDIYIEQRDENFIGIPKNPDYSYDALFWKELQKFLKENKDIDKELTLKWIKELSIQTPKDLLFDYIKDKETVTRNLIRNWMENRFSSKHMSKEPQKDNDGNILKKSGKEQKKNFFDSYHEIIKQQIYDHISIYCKLYNIGDPNISFHNKIYTDLADIECGLVLNKKEEKIKIESYSCLDIYDIEDPVKVFEKSPIQSLISLLREIEKEKYNNYNLVNKIFPELLKHADQDKTPYLYAWDCFYDFLKRQIYNRSNKGNLVNMRHCIDAFAQEFQSFISLNLKSIRESDIDLLILFTEYYSHIGNIELPFSQEDVEKVLQKDRRILHRWENQYRYNLRKAQMHFNAYKFQDDINVFSNMYEIQERLINDISSMGNTSDNHIITIINTMAQAHAFQGELDQAIGLFDSSLKYGDDSQTHSYMFTCFHRKKSLNESKEQFEKQIKQKAEEFCSNEKSHNVWNLLSYVKLRALDLYLNNSTSLKSIDLESKEKYYGNEYPFPLIKKWEAIALYFEDKDANKNKAKEYLKSAIKDLLLENNGFTINSLAIPVFQCLSYIDGNAEILNQYDGILEKLRENSIYFDNYVNKNTEIGKLNNNLDIWDRALLLPFNYA
jgi:hypothetical protein